MRRYYIISTLFIISLIVFSSVGCRDGSDSQSQPNKENKKATREITIGGKVWTINPDLSYQATGVWTNPNPRPLTDTERTRLKAIQAEILPLRTRLNELNAQLKQLNRESNALHRIEQPEIKVRYRFGKPPHLGPGRILDLGEFPMELKNGEFRVEMETQNQTQRE